MRKIIILAGKKSRVPLMTALWFLPAALLLLAAHPAEPASDVYAGLKQKLVRDGFPHRQVARLFQSTPPPMYRLVSRTLLLREGQLDYDQFLAPSKIENARGFIAKHRDAFQRAEKTCGVEPGVIAAILLVETHFGSYTGKTATLAVFTSFALMGEKEHRDRIWKLLPSRDRDRWGREAFDRKLLDRSEWAYRELAALLELENSSQVRPESLRGSVMGAFGWPQFLPTSLVEYGADGNGDGRIDLYDPDDAIMSTARYLQGHGWCEARFPSDRERVVWTYNHSTPYVRTVLEIAQRLREQKDL